MLILIGSPLSSAWLEARLGSPRYGLIRGWLGSVRLYSGLDSRQCSELGLVRLGSGSGLGSGGADKKCWSITDDPLVKVNISTCALFSLLGANMLLFIRLACEDNEINFPPTDLIRAAWTVFTSPGLRIRLGLARSSARFGSRSLFGLTRARFSARDTGTRLARFCSRLVSGCSRSGSARGSAYHSSGTDSVRLSSLHYLGLGSSRLVARAGLEARIGKREIGSMLDLAQLGARLRPSSGLSIGAPSSFPK